MFQTRHCKESCKQVTAQRQSDSGQNRWPARGQECRQSCSDYYKRRSKKRLRYQEAAAKEEKPLPAVAAITAVATISAIAAATPAATAAMPTASATTAAAETASAATTAAALLLRASFVDDEIAPTKVLAVHGIDRAIRFFVVGNFDESETARLAREPITNQIDCRGIDTSL
jgi:hypothetical protein